MEGEVGVISPATAFTSPSSCISSGSERDGGRGFNSLIGESPEMLFEPSSSRDSSVGGGACFGSLIPVSMQFSSPLSCVSAEGGGSGFGSLVGVTPGRGRESREVERFLRALRELSERYDDCFVRLRYATAEIAGLRRERLRLAAENLHLSLLLDDLEAAPNKQGLEAAPAPPVSSVATEETRGGVPKSISIRSKSFLSPPPPADEDKMQRLRVRVSPATEKTGEKGGEEERDKEAEVEVEAYRQGAEKTELCNKWERGACPYGDRCRFAHGLQELRPVIRHPRYKTLPCYMFTASGCPYGHRCHFRHSPPPTA